MKTEIVHQLIGLGIGLLIAAPIWANYRRRTFAPGERYSTFGPRFWTGPVDSCVLWPITFVTSIQLTSNPPLAVAAFLVITQSLAWLLYTVIMRARYGQTVGKMVTKVHVVDFSTEGRITLRQARLREGIPMIFSLGIVGYEVFAAINGDPSVTVQRRLLDSQARASSWLLATLPALWFLAEVLTMLTNDKRRALHDLIAGTVVIRTNIGTVTQQAPTRIGAPIDRPAASTI